MRALFISSILALFAIGCQRPPKHPDTPTIEFKQITAVSPLDSGYTTIDIQLYFTDGTGDLGLTQDDTSGIYEAVLDVRKSDSAKKYSRYYTNYWIDSYVKRDGQYILIKSPDDYHKYSSNFYIYDDRFKPFNDKYLTNANPIEGYLNYQFKVSQILSNTVTYRPDLIINDTMRFEIRILDRKLNISNLVTTTDVPVLQQ